MSDEDELAEILESAPGHRPNMDKHASPGKRSGLSGIDWGSNTAMSSPPPLEPTPAKEVGHLCQWTSPDNTNFIPSARSVPILPAGLYEFEYNSNIGVYASRSSIKGEEVVALPDSITVKVLQEIETFWKQEATYRQYGIHFKRGVFLWGPPGSGKSSTIRLVMEDLFERDGIVIKFGSPEMFNKGIKKLREIEPDRRIVVLMEDLDSTIRMYPETDVINILDGVDTIDKCIFIATSNYPELLGPRILNRPSRFDRRFKIGMPTPAAREAYLKRLFDKQFDGDADSVALSQWVADTDGMSIAHLKELFTACIIFGNPYKETLAIVKSMGRKLSSESTSGFSL